MNPYNLIAGQWAAIRNQMAVSQLVNDFTGLLPAGALILDVGCGTGYPISAYLVQRGLRVTGIDSAGEMIAQAQQSDLQHTQFLTCDFFDFPTDQLFDGIIAWDSFWHIQKAAQSRIYPHLRSLLKPGGYVLFTHGNTDDSHTDTMFGETFQYNALSTGQVRCLLNEHGFTIHYLHENYRDDAGHRALVGLAQKVKK